jgi:hypothetical protein
LLVVSILLGPISISRISFNEAIPQENASLSLFRYVRFMGDHHDGSAATMEGKQKAHDLIAGFRIQIARRLITQYKDGIINEGASYCYPLLLSSRHFCRFMMGSIGQTHRFQGRHSLFLPLRMG